MLEDDMSTLFILRPGAVRAPFTLEDLATGFEKDILKRIEIDISKIKTKLASLNGRSVSDHNSKTILQIILPKQILKKHKLLNYSKAKETKARITSQSKSLYSISEEFVKKLSLCDNYENIKLITLNKGNEISSKLIKVDPDIIPQIPNSKKEALLNSIINRNLNKINMTIKKSKLNLLVTEDHIVKSSKKLISVKEIEYANLIASDKYEIDNHNDLDIHHKSSSKFNFNNNTTRFNTLSSEEDMTKIMSSLRLPKVLQNVKHVTYTSRKQEFLMNTKKVKFESLDSKPCDKTRNYSSKTIISLQSFISEESENPAQSNFGTIMNCSDVPRSNYKKGISVITDSNEKLQESNLDTMHSLNNNILKTNQDNDTDMYYRQTNLVYEEKLERKLSTLQGLLAKMKEKHKYLCFGLERANTRLEEMKLEKDAISGDLMVSKKEYEKGEKKSLTIIRTPKTSTLKNAGLRIPAINNFSPLQIVKSASTISDETALILKSNQKVMLRRLEEQIQHLEAELKNANYIKNSFKQDILKVENRIDRYKTEIYKVKRKLLMYYHELLLEGNDTRSKGLTWIMIAIWKLGCEVFMSYMPKHLDNKLISYFFLRSHKEIELYKVQSLLGELKELVRVFRGKEYRKRKRINLKKFKKFEVII